MRPSTVVVALMVLLGYMGAAWADDLGITQWLHGQDMEAMKMLTVSEWESVKYRIEELERKVSGMQRGDAVR